MGTFNYGYVGNTGILARMDRPNGTSTLFGYENLQDPNSLHRLTGVQDVNSASGANIAGFSYGYDGANVQNGFRDNRTSQTRAYGSEAAQSISYGYNPTSMLQGEGAAHCLIGITSPGSSKWQFVYDGMSLIWQAPVVSVPTDVTLSLQVSDSNTDAAHVSVGRRETGVRADAPILAVDRPLQFQVTVHVNP